MLSKGPNDLLISIVNSSMGRLQITFHIVLYYIFHIFYNEHIESEKKLSVCVFF